MDPNETTQKLLFQAPEEEDFVSEIYCEAPSLPDPRFGDGIDATMLFLRGEIARLNPGSPDSLARFPSLANASLNYMAGLGINKDNLSQWVSLCREVEYVVAKMRKLNIMKRGNSLLELREQVRIRRETYDAFSVAFEESSQILQKHHIESSGHKLEMDKITSKLKKLLKKVEDLTSSKSKLETERNQVDRLIKREQRRYQRRHQALKEAEAALTRALEALRAAEAEYITLKSFMSRLRDLHARLL